MASGDSGGTYTSFDMAGATYGTYPRSINSKGEVTGYYLDSNDVYRSFVGTP